MSHIAKFLSITLLAINKGPLSCLETFFQLPLIQRRQEPIILLDNHLNDSQAGDLVTALNKYEG